MTTNLLTASMRSTALRVQERRMLEEVHDLLGDFLATRDHSALSLAAERCHAGIRRNGEQMERFARVWAKIQVYRIGRSERLIEDAMEITGG